MTEPPPGIAAPSKPSARELEKQTRSLSVLDRRVFLDLCVAMRSKRENSSEAGDEFLRIMRLLEGQDKKGQLFPKETEAGLFRGRYAVKASEMLYTSVLATKLAQLVPQVGGFPTRVLHQVPEWKDGKIDICIYAERSQRIWSPVVLFEFGLRCASKSKHDQVVAYGVNVAPQLEAGHVLLAVEVIVAPDDNLAATGWLRLSAMRLAEGRQVGVSPILWEGLLDSVAVSRLFEAVEIVACANFGSPDPWRMIKNAAFGGDFVWKVFDYRGRNVEEGDRRSPLYALRYVPGCECVLGQVGEDFVVIRYPFLKGSHVPSSVGQWVEVLKHVRSFHQDKIVHGDLRASNIVFGPDQSATIIDFDLAGIHNERPYPNGFNLKIEDGSRARGASEGRKLLFSHDWFAVAAMMKMCTVEREEGAWRAAWGQLEKLELSEADVDDVITVLDKCSDVEITSFKQGGNWQS